MKNYIGKAMWVKELKRHTLPSIFVGMRSVRPEVYPQDSSTGYYKSNSQTHFDLWRGMWSQGGWIDGNIRDQAPLYLFVSDLFQLVV